MFLLSGSVGPSSVMIYIAFVIAAAGGAADGSSASISAVALPATANASDSWQRLLFNQAKYEHRHASGRPPPQLQQLRATGAGGADSKATAEVPFEEQDYRLEDVMMRPGQMIELLGLENYLPHYMRFERPSSNRSDKDFDTDEDDKDQQDSSQPSLEQLLMVQRRPPDNHLRRRRHRSSGSRRRRGRRGNRQRRSDSNDSYKNQLSFLRRPQRRRLRRYLLEATACRVAPGWRDLGKAFWPRWLRQGECRQPAGGSCSIPSGMLCQPAKTKRLYVLRYLCARHWRRSQCRWMRQSVQVLQSCECRCG